MKGPAGSYKKISINSSAASGMEDEYSADRCWAVRFGESRTRPGIEYKIRETPVKP